MMMKNFTAFVKKTDDGWYVAQCLEISNAHAQGKTEAEALENLKEVIELLEECSREELVKEGFSPISKPLVLV